ncbi:9913_t:CDS:2 [Ambispora leptoticha]|uniref:9913_t:CDS:1 n=1 Tax=Ambispora leptoticha TaxID=144679 RepID=A0A9N9CXW0_9GLOM|nr:9913_t:CDS:2 [Ambispora leptoticha]
MSQKFCSQDFVLLIVPVMFPGSSWEIISLLSELEDSGIFVADASDIALLHG